MSKGFKIVWLGALVVFIAAVVSLRVLGTRGPDPAKPDDAVLGMSVPPFEMVDQDGKPATRDMLNGHVTILNFMFTHCRLVCPAMTDEMSKIADRLKGTGVRFVSMSVDPEHDTPASLKQFAAIYNADHSQWKFLAGKPGVVDVIVKDGLKFALEPDTSPDNIIPLGPPGGGMGDGGGKMGDPGASMSNIIHPEWFVLIGRDARVLGIYRYRDSERVEALVKRASEIDRRK